MKPLKYSRQRECMKEILISREDHPTADEIYMLVRELYPNVSLGTIYRNLSLLASLEEIRKLSYGKGPDRFDGNMVPHYHFVCNECGCVKDLHMPSLDMVIEQAEKYCEEQIEGYASYFYGTCKECLSKRNH